MCATYNQRGRLITHTLLLGLGPEAERALRAPAALPQAPRRPPHALLPRALPHMIDQPGAGPSGQAAGHLVATRMACQLRGALVQTIQRACAALLAYMRPPPHGEGPATCRAARTVTGSKQLRAPVKAPHPPPFNARRIACHARPVRSLGVQTHHPGWTFKRWDLRTARALAERDFPFMLPVFNAYAHPVQRADAARW
jgi:hypothetical protein